MIEIRCDRRVKVPALQRSPHSVITCCRRHLTKGEASDRFQTKSATSIEETKLGQVTLTIRGKMLYLYNLPQSSTIRVIDVKGRQLAVRNNTVGNDSISINATGMVIVKLSYGKATRTEKMVVK